MFSSLLSLKCLKSFIKWTKLCLSSIWLQNFNWFLNFSTLDGEWGGGGRTCLYFSHEFLKLHHRMIVNADHAKHETESGFLIFYQELKRSRMETIKVLVPILCDHHHCNCSYLCVWISDVCCISSVSITCILFSPALVTQYQSTPVSSGSSPLSSSVWCVRVSEIVKLKT